jgi:hypothetical protein
MSATRPSRHTPFRGMVYHDHVRDDCLDRHDAIVESITNVQSFFREPNTDHMIQLSKCTLRVTPPAGSPRLAHNAQRLPVVRTLPGHGSFFLRAQALVASVDNAKSSG